MRKEAENIFSGSFRKNKLSFVDTGIKFDYDNKQEKTLTPNT